MAIPTIHRQPLPLINITRRNTRIILRRARLAQNIPDLGHGADTDDALDGKVGLVGEGACEVVGGDLVGGDEGFGDEELGPLVKEFGLW